MTLSPKFQNAKDIKRFRRELLRWYARSKRDLPWRGQRDPYRIWVSEIMLQQTRVAVVQERYARFLRRFPTISRLASSPLSQVLAEWSGLGYYRRARNLHAAARELARRKQRFPRSAAELQRLPGIGRYTASAIASIAFAEPVAVVDGNVERVLRRLLAPRRPDWWHVAAELLDPVRPGDFNQAMMELGATVCLPGEPNCCACPVAQFCGLTAGSRIQNRASLPRKRQSLTFILNQKGKSVLLVQRGQSESLMPGMWELPACQGKRLKAQLHLRHSITNTDYEVKVRMEAGAIPHSTAGRWFRPEQMDKVPITGLTRKILKRAGVLSHRN
jgi:A/G-specific adenine glycosylase